jgi:hypothetical protein
MGGSPRDKGWLAMTVVTDLPSGLSGDVVTEPVTRHARDMARSANEMRDPTVAVSGRVTAHGPTVDQVRTALTHPLIRLSEQRRWGRSLFTWTITGAPREVLDTLDLVDAGMPVYVRFVNYRLRVSTRSARDVKRVIKHARKTGLAAFHAGDVLALSGRTEEWCVERLWAHLPPVGSPSGVTR